MNANAASVLFFVATVALLVAFSFDLQPPAGPPDVAAGMLGTQADDSNPKQHAAELSVALQNAGSSQTKR